MALILASYYEVFSHVFIDSSHRYQSILTLRQPLMKDNGHYTITVLSGSRTAQFSFNLKVKGKIDR